MFYVGQKVELVEWKADENKHVDGDPSLVGTVYTVSQVYHAKDGELMLCLWEIPNDDDPAMYAGFPARYFRPVVERKTDISIFTRMLEPQKETA